MSLDRSRYRYGTGEFFGKKDGGKGWEPCTREELEALRAEAADNPEVAGGALGTDATAILQALRDIKKESSRTNLILILLFIWLVVVPFFIAAITGS